MAALTRLLMEATQHGFQAAMADAIQKGVGKIQRADQKFQGEIAAGLLKKRGHQPAIECVEYEIVGQHRAGKAEHDAVGKRLQR